MRPTARRAGPSTWAVGALTVLAALAVTTAGARDARAQWAVGARGGYDLIEHDFSIGAQALLPFANLGAVAQAAAYPNLDAFFFEDRTRLRFDFDLVFPFRLQTVPLVPYVGLGFGIVYLNEDFLEETVFDFNLLTGLAVQTGSIVEPFAEADAGLFGTDTVAVIIGINVFPTGPPRRVAEPEPEENPADLPEPVVEDDF